MLWGVGDRGQCPAGVASVDRAPFLLQLEKMKPCSGLPRVGGVGVGGIPGGVAVLDFSAAAVRVSECAFSPPSSPKLEGPATHASLLASPALPTCATSLPTSFMLGNEVDAKKKKSVFPGSTAPLFKIT